MRLYVNGELAAEVKAPGLIESVPVQGLQVGADDGSAVGDYTTPFPFKGVVDEVRVYHRALNEQEMENSPTGAMNPRTSRSYFTPPLPPLKKGKPLMTLATSIQANLVG